MESPDGPCEIHPQKKLMSQLWKQNGDQLEVKPCHNPMFHGEPHDFMILEVSYLMDACHDFLNFPWQGLYPKSDTKCFLGRCLDPQMIDNSAQLPRYPKCGHEQKNE